MSNRKSNTGSGRPRYPVDVDSLMTTSNEGVAAIREGMRQKREHVSAAKSCCDNCGTVEDSKKPLQACTRCRSVRYCNKECQLQHYNATHKKDCANFKDPPLCRAFNTKMINPGCTYPETPVLGKGHCDGMGCWISSAGSIDCCLQTTVGKLTDSPGFKSDNMTPAQLQSFLPGAKGNYLEVTVFVQNRTSGKKATPMVVIGNAMTAVATAKGTKVLLDSKIPSQAYSMLGRDVIHLRVQHSRVTHINGKEVKTGEKPPALKDPSLTAILLNPGEHAKFTVQYFCGGPHITKDFEALELLDYILVSSIRYDPSFSGTYRQQLSQAAEKDEVCEVRGHIDQRMVAYWYKDYKEKGQNAYIASHYGEARATMIETGNTALQQMTIQLMSMAMGMPGMGLGSMR